MQRQVLCAPVLLVLFLVAAVSVPLCLADLPPNPVATPPTKPDKSANKPLPKARPAPVPVSSPTPANPSPKPSIKPTPTPTVPRASGDGGAGAAKISASAKYSGRPGYVDIDFGPYMADLQRRIKRAWFPPKGMESKVVTTVFKVHQQGQLSDLKLQKSSGVAIADQAALKAVENAAPFRPLPQGSPENIDIQFTFDYNVFNGRGGGIYKPAPRAASSGQ